jgi:pyrroline-5-carboxylate reductase
MNKDLSQVRVAVLGAGKMGGILLQAFLKQQLFAPEQIVATVAHEERAQVLSAQWGVEVTTDNVAAVKNADLILLGVKPFQVADLVKQIKPALTADKMLISFATGVKTNTMEEAAGLAIPVVRSMPNTPSMLGVGMTALCRGKHVTDAEMLLASRIY